VRTLIVSQYFWPEEFRINEVTRSLVEKGLQVDVLTGKPNYPQGQIYKNFRFWGVAHDFFHHAQVSRVPLIPRGKNSGLGLALNYLSFIFFGMICGPWLMRNKKHDVIFVYGVSPILSAIPALFIGWLKKAPVVIWVQDLWPQSLSATGYVRNRYVLRAVEQVVRFIYSRADLLLVQSKAFVEPVRHLASDTPIQYYPNSVDDSFAKPAVTAAPFVAGMDAAFTVLFAGNVGMAQAVPVIVDAAARIQKYSDIQIVVLGDGSARPWMLEQVAKLGLTNLHLPGRFPVETMPSFMQKASVLLVTLADQDIFAATVPNKVQAYMATGRPIIACMNGEGAKLISDAQAGLAVPAEDGAALADAILQMYRMTDVQRNQIALNAKTYYHEHFEHDKLIEQLIEILRNVRKATQ
jgi:glycosyltransferase involved in cell wall biosynthesis